MSEEHAAAVPAAPAAPEQPALTPAAAPEPAPQPTEQGPVPTEAAAVPASPETAAEPASEATPAEPSLLSTDAPAAEPIAYEAFTLPEGVKPDAERMGAFTALVGEHKLPQEAAQALIDIYAAEREQYVAAVAQNQTDVWNAQNEAWVKEVDTRFGNRRDTVLNDARSALRLAASNDAHLGRMWQALALTGAGNHPDVIEGWANIHRLLSERKAPPQPDAPPKTNGAGPRPEDRRYPTMNTPRSQ